MRASVGHSGCYSLTLTTWPAHHLFRLYNPCSLYFLTGLYSNLLIFPIHLSILFSVMLIFSSLEIVDFWVSLLYRHTGKIFVLEEVLCCYGKLRINKVSSQFLKSNPTCSHLHWIQYMFVEQAPWGAHSDAYWNLGKDILYPLDLFCADG